MRKFAAVTITVMILALGLPASARAEGKSSEKSYWHNWGYDMKRGFKNIITSPLEIPMTIQDYHERSGPPVIRHLGGLGDGVMQMFTRAGSGIWDWIWAAWIPGAQEGYPPDPETLF